jgi:hypothetical protein
LREKNQAVAPEAKRPLLDNHLTRKTSTKVRTRPEHLKQNALCSAIALRENRPEHLKQNAFCSEITLREKNQAGASKANYPLLGNHFTGKEQSRST